MTKKFFAILLALVLTLSLSAVAFAVDGEPDGGNTQTTPPSITVGNDRYTDITSVTIEKIYKLENEGTTSPEETFTVELVSSSVKTGDATSAPALGTITGAYFAENAATKSGAKANITIALPTYDKVGVYEYILKETVGSTAGVDYRSASDTIKLVVTVMQGEDGKVRVAGVHTEGSDSTTKTGSITNTYKAGSLSIMKTVSGNMADHEKYFEFDVTLTGETGKTYLNSYAVSGGSDNRNPQIVAINGTSFKVYLKADETLTIANLPYGVTYTVDEIAYDGYTTTGEVTTAKTINSASVTETINNAKAGTVDTGVTMDSMPYIVLLALAVVGLAAVTMKKRYEA